jgi:putative transcriptional regulator
MSVNLYLKSLRVRNQLTQLDVAIKLNLTVSAYNRKENGKRDFTLTEALAISGIFEKPIEEIFID